MDTGSTATFVALFSERLNDEFHVDAWVPLDIKLRLERLRLKELLSAMRGKGDEVASRTLAASEA
jgi:hypothetical protein